MRARLFMAAAACMYVKMCMSRFWFSSYVVRTYIHYKHMVINFNQVSDYALYDSLTILHTSFFPETIQCFHSYFQNVAKVRNEYE